MQFSFSSSAFLAAILLTSGLPLRAQSPPSSPSSHSSSRKSAPSSVPRLDPGSVSQGVYRNSSLGLSCKIPEGWVLRTEEMKASDDSENGDNAESQAGSGERVLLAAFSRPPQARGEDINGSILIAAESASAYPGLKEAVQYFSPIAEIAKAQGFVVSEEPYEIAIGSKTLVRGDFQKDVGTRVMHQSTLAMLAKGYAISFTFIGGTEDEVEELIDELTFTGSGKVAQ